MADIESLSIALSSDVATTVKAAVEAGEYATLGDVVRQALQDWTSKHAAGSPSRDDLRRQVQAGVDSGPSVDAKPVFARLRAKYAAAA